MAELKTTAESRKFLKVLTSDREYALHPLKLHIYNMSLTFTLDRRYVARN
jgi:hypothetical protein